MNYFMVKAVTQSRALHLTSLFLLHWVDSIVLIPLPSKKLSFGREYIHQYQMSQSLSMHWDVADASSNCSVSSFVLRWNGKRILQQAWVATSIHIQGVHDIAIQYHRTLEDLDGRRAPSLRRVKNQDVE